MAENTDEVYSHSSFLFMDESCQPIQFYIRPSETRAELRPLIESGGGEIASRFDKASDNVIKILAEGDECLSDDYVSHTYIVDCVAANILLQKCNYRVTNSKQQNITPYCTVVSAGAGKGRSNYTSEEDKSILQYIAKHPYAYGGNQVWKKMEILKITDHPWQSMRDHFLKKLEGKLKKYLNERRERLKVTRISAKGVDGREDQHTTDDSDVDIEDVSNSGSDADGEPKARRKLLAADENEKEDNKASGEESDRSSFDVDLFNTAKKSSKSPAKNTAPLNKSSKQIQPLATTVSATTATSTRITRGSKQVGSGINTEDIAPSSVVYNTRSTKASVAVDCTKKNSNEEDDVVGKNKTSHDEASVTVHNTRSSSRRNKDTESSATQKDSPRKRNGQAPVTRRRAKRERSDEEEMETVEEEEWMIVNDDETQIDSVDAHDDEEVTVGDNRAVTRSSQRRTPSPNKVTLVRLTPGKKQRRTPGKHLATPANISKTADSSGKVSSPKSSQMVRSPIVLRRSGRKDIDRESTKKVEKDSDEVSSTAKSSHVVRRTHRKEMETNTLEEEEEPSGSGGEDKVQTSTGGEEADSESSPATRKVPRNQWRRNCIVAESEMENTDSDVIPMMRTRRRGLTSVVDETSIVVIPETQEFEVTTDKTNGNVVIPETQEFEVTTDETNGNASGSGSDEENPDTQVPELEENEDGIEECRQIVADLSKQFKLSLEEVCAALYMNNGDVAETRVYLTTGKLKSGHLWKKFDDDRLLSPSSSEIRAAEKQYGERQVTKRLKFLAS